jgi:hypothetical protein
MSTELQLEPAAHPAALNAAISKIRFAWALPLGELVLCAILLWPVRLWILHELGIHLPSWLEQLMGLRYGLLPISPDFSTGAAAALNLPGMEIQLPYIILSANKMEWMPIAMDFRVWRAITLPFLCLPFWWMAGRAIDALIAIPKRKLIPRIGWTETIIGFLLMTTCAIGFAGLLLSGSKEDKDSVTIRFVAGCGLWALLGSLSVIARFRQWRLRRQQQKLSSPQPLSSLSLS